MFLTKGKAQQQTLHKQMHQLSPSLIAPQSSILVLPKKPATKIIKT